MFLLILYIITTLCFAVNIPYIKKQKKILKNREATMLKKKIDMYDTFKSVYM